MPLPRALALIDGRPRRGDHVDGVHADPRGAWKPMTPLRAWPLATPGSFRAPRCRTRVAASALFPDWWGRPSSIEAPLTVSNVAALGANYCERTFYAGAVALLLACIGLVTPRHLAAHPSRSPSWDSPGPGGCRARPRPDLAGDAPAGDRIGRTAPTALRVRAGGPVLAAFGLQAILDAPAALRRRLAVVLVAGVRGTRRRLRARARGACRCVTRSTTS